MKKEKFLKSKFQLLNDEKRALILQNEEMFRLFIQFETNKFETEGLESLKGSPVTPFKGKIKDDFEKMMKAINRPKLQSKFIGSQVELRR